MIRLFFSALIITILFSSCHFMGNKTINGSGNVVTQSRSVANFKSIEVDNAVNVYITQDSAFSVKVTIDENLQQYIEVYEKDGVLHVGQKNNTSVNPTGHMKVYVSAPAFERLEASGASYITAEQKITAASVITLDASGASHISAEIQAPKTDAEATGASGLTLKGQTKDLSISGQGASHIKCFDLLAENVDVDVSGASSADVFASVDLKAEASGASEIRYKGAANYTGNSSGASNIRKAE